MILPALSRGGYSYETQVDIGRRLNGGRHLVDVLAKKDGRRYLISLKWQQVGGTAEQKVPFEVISLVEAIHDTGFCQRSQKCNTSIFETLVAPESPVGPLVVRFRPWPLRASWDLR